MYSAPQTHNRQGHGGGPKTPDGKRRVSRNAITHGLTCADVVLPGEDSAEFGQLRAAMLADTQPVGAEEQNAVERMIASEWKLRRLWRQEGEVYAFNRFRLKDPKAGVGVCLLKDMMHQNAFARLTRQEAHLDRMYTRASRRLQELQDLRRKGLRHVIEEEDVPAAAGAQPVGTSAATSGPAGHQGPADPPTVNTTDTGHSQGHPAPQWEAASDSNQSASGKIAKQTSGVSRAAQGAA